MHFSGIESFIDLLIEFPRLPPPFMDCGTSFANKCTIVTTESCGIVILTFRVFFACLVFSKASCISNRCSTWKADCSPASPLGDSLYYMSITIIITSHTMWAINSPFPSVWANGTMQGQVNVEDLKSMVDLVTHIELAVLCTDLKILPM